MTVTRPLALPRLTPAPAPHEHGWLVESRHPTSDGTVVYVRCADCGIRRVDLQPGPAGLPPAPLSRPLSAP